MKFEDDILVKITKDFANKTDQVISLISDAIDEQPAIDSYRIVRCIIYLSEGTIAGLKESIEMAMIDPRDVMMCAEYEYDPIKNQDDRKRDFNLPFGVNDLHNSGS